MITNDDFKLPVKGVQGWAGGHFRSMGIQALGIRQGVDNGLQSS